MSGCTVQRLEAPGLTFLKVSGTVDETFSASQLSQQIRADTILHLGKVSRFSSFGVREWVKLMKDLQGRVKHCILVECSPAVVNQLNVVVDFAAGAHVKSVQLPYACQRCELDKIVTVDVDADRAQLLAGHLPQVPCPQCNNPMVFDDLPGSYLAFLRDATAPEPGSPMAAFINSFEQAAPKLADAETPSGSQPVATRSAAPAIDPTVPPPGMASAAGMPQAAKLAAAVALLILLAGGGYLAFGKRSGNGNGTGNGMTTTGGNDTNHHPPPPPPGPPPKRAMTVEEGMELQAMINAERFSDAEAWIKKKEPVLLEESIQKDTALVQASRTASCEKHMASAQSMMQEGKSRQALDELDIAAAFCGETDRLLWKRIGAERRNGNCPAVIAAADAIAERFADSSFLKQASDAKKACLAPPAIGAAELKKAMAVVQNDINRCLAAPRAPDQAGNSIDMAWTVNPTGAVTQASCTTPSMAKSALCQCLTETVRRLKFTAKPEVQARRGAYTFNPGTSG